MEPQRRPDRTRVVILGALSGMATAIARIYAARGADLGLLGASAERLADLAADLRVRGAGNVKIFAGDLSAPISYEAIIGEFTGEMGGIDVLILAYGILGDQARAQRDPQHAADILNTNFTSAALWLLAAAKRMDGEAVIAVFSSVAGDRGRQSNYVYGSAKAGLAVFAEGMAHELAASGPRMIVIKPGFVVTPMTEGMKRSGPLWTDARRAARMVVAAIDRKRGPVVYVPGFWRWIMLIVRLLPAAILHRTKL
ncbi:MAG TPA: SDR family NAD(P)-dependent oxidoreductase [Steroidobacteraceae bacterium]|nr:SDR family NAD(P)-dependent oxidoreductase [Steroidobacteraceae bacterium]